MSETKLGKIIKLQPEKGYGFITSKDVPFERIFFHWTGLHNETIRFLELKEGMDVEFEVKEGPRGMRAIKIWILEDDEKVGRKNNASNMETPT